MSRDWDENEESIQVQQIIQVGETFAVTLTKEMLGYLKVSAGDDVEVEMKEHKLIIRKIIPREPPEGFSEDFFRTLNEKLVKYDDLLKPKKE